MKLLLKSTLAYGIIASMFYSCTDDYFEFDKIGVNEWRPELAVPLVNSSLTLEDIIINNDTNGLIQKNPNNNILEIVYDGRVFTKSGEELVVLPNNRLEEDINGITIPPTGPNTVTVSRSINVAYNIGSAVEIDSVLLKNGSLQITLLSLFQHDIDVQLTLPGFKNANGEILSRNFSIPPSNGSTATIGTLTTPIDLNGYTLDMSNGGSTFNNISIDASITLTRVDGNPSSNSDNLKLVAQLSNLRFKEFNGYVGQTDLELNIDTIPINVFTNFVNGTFFLANPFLDITVESGYGIPVNLGFQKLIARNPDRNPDSITINLPQNPIQLTAPPKNQISETVVKLDSSNSNIPTVVSFLLKEVVYDAVASFNPNGRPPLGQPRNFLTDDSQINLDVFLRMPFEGYASGFTLVDTIDFEFENSDELDNGLIRVIAENTFPISSDFQVIFADSLYNPIDSLYLPDAQNPQGKQTIIPAAPLDANGDVIRSSRKVTDVEIDTKRLGRLSDGKYVIIKAELETTDALSQRIVRFYENYKLDISLGLKARILID